MTLPGVVLEKKRYYYPYTPALMIGHDEITFPKEVLWMAEVEFKAEHQLEQFVFSLAFEKEVTNDPAYAGKILAKLCSKTSKTDTLWKKK